MALSVYREGAPEGRVSIFFWPVRSRPGKVTVMASPYPTLKSRAREMRKGATEAERRLWAKLRSRRLGGLKFLRQFPAGPYILDFYCSEKNLAVELDGGQHGDPGQAAYDEERSRILTGLGIRVIRFWNHDVLKDTDAVLNVIGKEAGIF